MDPDLEVSAGAQFGAYEILAPLGGGGMGRVYRARDRRLGRTVAIKLIAPEIANDPQALARLRREAEAASSLNHPAIVTIYDIGDMPQFFIAMEFVEGVNFREWLREGRSSGEAMDILQQVAGGLAAAHSRGIVHRDIKPENIMVTPEGFAKIVDFGLAKLATRQEAFSTGEPTNLRTADGHVLGTTAYMSPEQLRGQALDARSDIFSFGCVLHEALSGRAPFLGKSPADTIGRILQDEPDPLSGSVGAPLRAIIARCLAKERAARYATMDDVAADLRRARSGDTGPVIRRRAAPWVFAALALCVFVAGAFLVIASRNRFHAAAGAGLPAASIAVLPFRTLSGATYVADGISDALTTDLARRRDLTVIARNSADRYSDVDLRRAGEQLRVRYLLLGSVQMLPQSVRVNARLVDAATEAHVWADHYERPLSGIFSAEEAIVQAVADRLAPHRGEMGPPVVQPSDPRVADLYLRGSFFADDPNWRTEDRSIPLLEQVVQLDPAFLPARIKLAQQYSRKAFELDRQQTWAEKAFVELQKILTQDPSAAAAYSIRADLHWNRTHGFNHEEALADLDRAIRIDPNLVDGYGSRGSILMHVGLLDDALADFTKVLRLDPFNEFAGYRIARIHLYQQKCAEAAAEFKKRWPNDFQLPVALECAGQSEEAVATLNRLAVEPAAGLGAESDLASTRAVIYALHGRRAEAKQAIREAMAKDKGGSHFHHAMYYIAAAYARLGDAADAVQWLERTSQEGMPCYPLFKSDPLLDPIRSDARMQKFLEAQRNEWEELRRARHSV